MNESSRERRHHPRRVVHIPLCIDAGERRNRLGVTTDATADSVRFCSPSRFEPGDELEITLRAAEWQRTACGTVVRTEPVGPKSHYVWRYLTVVRFETTLPELGL